MKRVTIIGLLALVPAFSTTGVNTASATKCFKVVPWIQIGSTTKFLQGDFDDSSCSKSGGIRLYVFAETWGSSTWTKRAGDNNEYCTQSEEMATGFWDNFTCTSPLEGHEGLHKWTLVYAKPGFLFGIAPLKALAVGTQVMHLNGGGVECTKATGEVEVHTTKASTQPIAITYSGCVAFGVAATITGAEYEIYANGAIGVTSKGLVIRSAVGNCSIKIQGGGSNKTLESVIYSKSGTKETAAVATVSVKGIHYESSGGICGSSGTNGLYNGRLELLQIGHSVADELEPLF